MAEECYDIGMQKGSKFSCHDFACLDLCKLDHVKKLCRHSCGICGSKSTVGIPAPPSIQILERGKHFAQLTFLFQESSCPLKSFELHHRPTVRGRHTTLGTIHAGESGEERYILRGIMPDISYDLQLRVRNSFGWSKSSPRLKIHPQNSMVERRVSFVASDAEKDDFVHKQGKLWEKDHLEKKKRLIARARKEALEHANTDSIANEEL